MTFTLINQGVTLAGIENESVAYKLERLGWKIVEGESSTAEEEPETESETTEEVESITEIQTVMNKLEISDPELLRDISDEKILELYGVGPAALEIVREHFPERGE